MTRVVLVEDDSWLADMEASVLRAAGYEVKTAPHALAAIDYIDDTVPDVLILDVLLAGSTAFALLNELQSHHDTARLPVILCTNVAEQFDAVRLKEYGVRRVVDKTTMHPEDLVTAVKAVCGE